VAVPVNDALGRDRSGPAVARLYHRLLAAIFLIAWASLGVQVDVLIGSRGLLPAAPFLDAARLQGRGIAQLPTVFWLDASDTALHAGIWLGAALSLAALCGLRPRLCTGLATALYLSYATVARTFLSFQWDNLLLECGLLAVFLPTDRPARWVHVLFRILLVKLYWESGIAKWQSYAGDWQNGSAMTFYYETAPLPTWVAWYAHHLPVWWHHLESWGVLVLELVLPWFAFGPRVLALFAFVALTGFQIINLLTSNYGFFAYLALALHVFLLTDGDVERLGAPLQRWVPTRTRRAAAARTMTAWERHVRAAGAAVIVAIFVGVSAVDASAAFVPLPRGLQGVVGRLISIYEPWRLINTYHLFGHITEERIEPEFQVQSDGAWQTINLWHKPGDPRRAPDFVAPHQPRVDFQLWFYGLSFQRGAPEYVGTLLWRLCNDPHAVQSLFATPLPAAPEAVRIAFWRYRFSPPGDTDAWWTRELIGSTRPFECAAWRS
jgi:hypothetical protein